MQNNDITTFKNSLPADEMEECVLGVKRGDKRFMQKLYDAFIGLIIQEACENTYIHDALGEDAENIAWIIFYEFFKRYKGNRWAELPGLVKIELQEALRDVVKGGRRVGQDTTGKTFISIDQNEVLGNSIPSYWEDLRQSEGYMEAQRMLKPLPPVPRMIVQWNVIDDYSLEDCSQMAGIPLSTCKTYKYRSLNKLRQTLTKKKPDPAQ